MTHLWRQCVDFSKPNMNKLSLQTILVQQSEEINWTDELIYKPHSNNNFQFNIIIHMPGVIHDGKAEGEIWCSRK